MASTIWNQETKHRLNEKITSNVNDMASLVRQITRGSKSGDVSWSHNTVDSDWSSFASH